MTANTRLARPLYLALLAAWASCMPASAQGSFVRVGDTTVGRNLSQVSLLPDGRVLVTGGTRTGDAGSVFNREAELYDPATRAFTATGPMSTPRLSHASVTLADGRVLILGGTSDGTETAALNTSETFDPATGSFKVTATMASPRIGATAHLLKDGRVLVIGGTFTRGADPFFVTGTNIYDPATDTFAVSGRLLQVRPEHTAIALPDGRVLVIGGLGEDPLGPGLILIRDVEAFDPATGSFSVIGQLAEGRIRHQLTLLEDGKVLVSGGLTLNAEQQAVASNSLEVFDPATGTSGALVTMKEARRHHVAITLANGRVLLAGGTSATGSVASAELFDPATGSTTAIGPMTESRTQFKAVRLLDGTVLIVGGARLEGNTVAARLNTAEIYTP